MQIINEFWYIWIILFLISISYILYNKKNKKELKAQFVLTGILLIIFYIVAFLSGICTILNFLFKWIIK